MRSSGGSPRLSPLGVQSVQVVLQTVYLGILIGPLVAGHQRDQVIVTYEKRSRPIAAMQTGRVLSLAMFNLFAVSVVAYVGQFVSVQVGFANK